MNPSAVNLQMYHPTSCQKSIWRETPSWISINCCRCNYIWPMFTKFQNSYTVEITYSIRNKRVIIHVCVTRHGSAIIAEADTPERWVFLPFSSTSRLIEPRLTTSGRSARSGRLPGCKLKATTPQSSMCDCLSSTYAVNCSAEWLGFLYRKLLYICIYRLIARMLSMHSVTSLLRTYCSFRSYIIHSNGID